MRKPIDRRRVLDWLRHALVALLLISALFLLRRTGYYAGIRSLLSSAPAGGESAGTDEPAAADASVGVKCVAVTVCGPEGGARYGVAYDPAAEGLLRRFSVDLGEALGSADDPAECTEDALRARLAESCVCFHFADPIPLGLLAGWLGTDMAGAAAGDSAAFLCLSAARDTTTLCYRTPEGACFTCATAAKPEALRVRTLDYPPNGARYAWETERLGDGDALLLSGAPQPAVLKSAVALPAGAERDALLSAVGMNSFVASSYTESDGTVVYVNDETTLRLSPGGTATFRRGAADAHGRDTMAAAVETAWRLIERSVGQSSGDGTLYFAGIRRNEARQSWTVLADYMADGIPVRLAAGHAAEIEVRYEAVVQAQLQFRRFTRTEERTALLPWLQAAAIAQAQGSEPALIYADAGDATECMWVIADG